jgi:hypothetical protein
MVTEGGFALPRLRGRCQRLTLTEGVMRITPSVADYRAPPPKTGEGR